MTQTPDGPAYPATVTHFPRPKPRPVFARDRKN